MVWAVNWFVYDPGKRLVHQEDGCANSSSPTLAKRQGWRRVGNASMATLDEAVAEARELLDPEAQPCRHCWRNFDIGRGISDDTWRGMVNKFLDQRPF